MIVAVSTGIKVFRWPCVGVPGHIDHSSPSQHGSLE